MKYEVGKLYEREGMLVGCVEVSSTEACFKNDEGMFFSRLLTQPRLPEVTLPQAKFRPAYSPDQIDSLAHKIRTVAWLHDDVLGELIRCYKLLEEAERMALRYATLKSETHEDTQPARKFLEKLSK